MGQERKGRKKRIIVRHHNLNGENIILERRVLSKVFIFFPVLWIFIPLGLGFVWKPWRLLNSELYEIEDKIYECVDKLQDLMRKRLEVEEQLKREKKDITESTQSTYGFSDPFPMWVPVSELPFKKQKWLQRPDGDWRKFLNPSAFPGLKKGKMSTREKLGLSDDPPAATRTAYVPSNFENVRATLEEVTGVDHVMTFKEPQEQKKKQGNKSNNSRRNNRRDDYDDDDYDD